MMTRGVEIEDLTAARRNGYALAGINVYNLDLTNAVVAAAEKENTRVLLQTGSSALRWGGERTLSAMTVAAADSTTARIGVHLDHSRNLDEVHHCLEAGYTSVMIDGSALPFEDNIALTREAVGLARDYGAWVEAELGAVAGQEDRSVATTGGPMTDPGQAEEFIARTGADALAVAVGNVHGVASGPPQLDLHRLEAIAAAVPVPLVLHGASGIPDEQIARATELGVAKFNVNTEVRQVYLAAARASLADRHSDDLATLFTPARQAATQAVRDKIDRVSSETV